MNEDEKLLERLKLIKGKELKYKQLCEELNLKIKGGESKKAQLNNLLMYCDLEKLEKPTRFKVNEVYDEVILGLGILSKNNKYQILFEAALYQEFLRNGGEPLWLSNMDTLKLFQEINENFSYACNKESMKKMGEEFMYMASMSQVVYKILNQWTKRRIQIMVKRGVVDLSTGYRLYTKHYGKYGEYRTLKNIPIGSETAKICLAIWNEAVREKLPSGWDGGWVPDWRWYNFEAHIATLVKERFDGEYCDMRRVIILSPPSIDWVRERLAEMYRDIKALTGINEEACNKILNTSQLDHKRGEERKKFIDINMSIVPPFLFKEKLRKDN